MRRRLREYVASEPVPVSTTANVKAWAHYALMDPEYVSYYITIAAAALIRDSRRQTRRRSAAVSSTAVLKQRDTIPGGVLGTLRRSAVVFPDENCTDRLVQYHIFPSVMDRTMDHGALRVRAACIRIVQQIAIMIAWVALQFAA